MVMDAYTFLLMWQALTAGSAWYLRPAGWLWMGMVLVVLFIVEYAVSVIAQKRHLQAFSTPFKGSKYKQDVSLVLMQCAATSALSVIVLMSLAFQGSWNLFWILLAGSIMLAGLMAYKLRRS